MQQEVALAKAELRESGPQAGKGIGLFVGAAVAGVLFLVFLSVCAWWGLGQFIGNQWSALIVAAVWVDRRRLLAAGWARRSWSASGVCHRPPTP